MDQAEKNQKAGTHWSKTTCIQSSNFADIQTVRSQRLDFEKNADWKPPGVKSAEPGQA